MKATLSFLYSLLLFSSGFAKDKRPNVVTLLVDDLGYRDLGCYGGPVKTPVLDKLAGEGVRFTDFHSGAPVCSPSRATFLTGRNHIRAGVYSVLSEQRHRMHLLRSETTLAEVLKDEGYGTAHLGKWHLGMPVNNRDNPTPAEHGFDYWFGLVNGAHPSHKDPTNFLRNGKPVGPMKGYSCQIVVDEAIAWLDEKRDADAPFFINLWFNEPHAVIAAPDEIVSRYGALNNQAAIYNGTIDNTDRAIGRLVAKLEKFGELDNTIIHYSSDNGSYRQERSGELRGKKGSHHEGGHRVPGIFYWKGKIPGGRIEKEPAGAVDLLPTLCGLLGIDKPKDVFLDGSDLTPLLTHTGSFERHQPLFWMNGSTMAIRMGDHTLLAPSTARLPFENAKANRLLQQTKLALGDDLEKELGGLDLRSRMFNGRFANRAANRLRDEFRSLFYFNEALIPLMKKGGVDRVQLYDLSKDLGQQNDIAKERPELVARMKKQANLIYKSVMADGPEYVTPEEQAAAKKPRGNGPQRPVTGAPDTDTAKLLARIDKNPVPKGYLASRHQAYVDKVMAGLKPEPRAWVGQLWKEKRRLDSDMPNPGASFVRILTHIAEENQKSKQSNLMKSAESWAHWRGPSANGVVPSAKPPTHWSEKKNVRWKVPIDGAGASTPIIWKDKIFLLSVIDTGNVDPSLPRPEDQPKRVFDITHPNTEFKFLVICLDRKNGKELWRREATRLIPHEGTHRDNNYASASPTTDGKLLYCWFGSAGLFCYDLEGNKVWERNLGEVKIGASLGEGCSPVLYKDKLVILRDNRGQSTIQVLNAKNGETIWKKNRNTRNGWATPAVVEHEGKVQVITTASRPEAGNRKTPGKVISYDLENGKVIWECSGLTDNAIPCPIVENGVAYCMTGYQGFSILAVPISGKGDQSKNILWKRELGTPYVPSPVLYEGLLYFTQSNQVILSCVDAKTGKVLMERTRLPGLSNVYASLVGAGNHIYVVGRYGKTAVLKRTGKFDLVTTNTLADRFDASPAVVGDQIFLRGHKFLYCIERE
jgi:arylsulfatase A